MFAELLSALTIIGILFYKYWTWNYNYWNERNVVHLKAKFPFGNIKDLLLMKKTIGQLYNEIYMKFKNEPFVGLYKIRDPILMVRDPELVKSVFVKEFHCFDGNDYFVDPNVDPLLGINPFNNRGKIWKLNRSIVSIPLTATKVKSMFPQIIKISNEMVAYLQNNKEQYIETYDLAGKYTTDIVACCGYAFRSNSFTDPESEFRKMSAGIFSSGFKGNAAILFAFYAPKLGSFFKWPILNVVTTNYFVELIEEAAEYRIKNEISVNDLLQSLIDANLEAKKRNEAPVYSHEEIAGHCMTFSLDGLETGALLLNYLLYELSMNRDVQNKLRTEILKKIDHLENAEFENIHSIDYLDWTIQECLRKHSPGTMIARKCNKSVLLESSVGKSVMVEAGVPVVIPLSALHMDPIHFPEPEKFKPERFSGTPAHHSYAYIPFGGGPRACPGQKFAQTMIKMGLISILINFDVLPKDKSLTKIEDHVMHTFFHHPNCDIFVSFQSL